MSALPPLTEQTAALGTKLNGYDRTITRDNVETFVSLTGETVDSSLVKGELSVPTGMLMGLYGPLSHGTFHYEAGVHVSSELELGRVPRVDEPIRVDGQVLDLFEKNGHKYVTFSVEVSTASGERLATVAHTSIYALRAKPA
ncbi:MAG TPA: hypothetical protein QGI71_01410 [Dehalococcoidia bacterium]|jgi:hypothetical protein|nr:hypothetical protein [Dehalococcoidia bacterium]